MLQLAESTRLELWNQVARVIEDYLASVDNLPVSPELNPDAIRNLLSRFDFEVPMPANHAVAEAASGLTKWQVHSAHARYFGLFNPAPTTMGIAADALVAAFNPQIAAWSHNPFAAEVEAHLIRCLAERFGYPSDSSDGCFTSGGMEANHTAVLVALTHAFPNFKDRGLRSVEGVPTIYTSAEGHHSLLKAARMCGLGSEALRSIPTNGESRIDISALRHALVADRSNGRVPFLLAATAGTTATGTVDPLAECAQVAREHGLWLHVDAAWGGAAVIDPDLRPLLAGVEQCDSITFDAHKWFSVPMGCGTFLTRHPNALSRTFHIATGYMPKEAASLDIVDPHQHTMQWSRRFIGLKLFLSLAVAGWSGYQAAVRHQTEMGNLLRSQLTEHGWEIVNRTPLPVICFVQPDASDDRHRQMCARVLASGAAWLSTVPIGVEPRIALRACITNFRTQPDDIHALVGALNRARGEAASHL